MDFVSDTFSKSLLHGLYTQINISPYTKYALKKTGIWKIQKNSFDLKW